MGYSKIGGNIMNETYELLEEVYKTAAMGRFSMMKLIEALKEKDNKIKGYLEELLEDYRNYEDQSKELLLKENIEPMEENAISKLMASMGIQKEVKGDNSDAAMAEMLIQGISMGSIEIEKQIKNYKDHVDKDDMKLAKKFLKFQEKAIEELKKYL